MAVAYVLDDLALLARRNHALLNQVQSLEAQLDKLQPKPSEVGRASTKRGRSSKKARGTRPTKRSTSSRAQAPNQPEARTEQQTEQQEEHTEEQPQAASHEAEPKLAKSSEARKAGNEQKSDWCTLQCFGFGAELLHKNDFQRLAKARDELVNCVLQLHAGGTDVRPLRELLRTQRKQTEAGLRGLYHKRLSPRLIDALDALARA